MKVAYLIYSLDTKNGWGRYASDLIYGVKDKGHEVVIIKMIDDGLAGHVVLKRGLGMLGCIRKVRSLIAGCDVVHAMDVYPYGIIAYLATRFTSKKLVISLLGTYSVAPFYNRGTKFFSRLALKSAHALIAISRFTRQEVYKALPLKNIEVITPGIDFNAFYQRRGISEKYILSVGALKPRKGYLISIAAFARAKEKISGLKYKIVGSQDDDHNYVASVRALIMEKGLQKDVEIFSNVSDSQLKQLYAAADLFILTSVNEGYHFEGFGLVFLEAAAAGLPVVGTRGNGIEDTVNDGINGMLVSQGDITQTARVIETIANDDELWQRMSGASYAWARGHSLDEEVRRYIEIYGNT